ncbi:MAG: aldo/keto reductase [Oscillospiraceae bacterium]|nr:aldo/keto reductase [Oscillospiraceae bacterium]
MPSLGQGGWTLGDDPSRAEEEIRALRLGVSLGMNLIDTAEMYGSGRSEELIRRALRGVPRKEYQLVSKVLPQNAGEGRIFQSCEQSLRRLGTDCLDLYLLHWRGPVSLQETVCCMEGLKRAGKIRFWGVSNFDTPDMEELWAVPGGENCAANQVMYHLGSRGIEFDLLPWLAAHGVAAMAYCPLAQGGRLARMRQNLVSDPALLRVAAKYGVTTAQILLAFVLRQKNITAVPKAGTAAHVRENAASCALRIDAPDWGEIDAVFPPPAHKMHLDIE